MSSQAASIRSGARYSSSRIGDFALHTMIGTGSTAEVWRVVHQPTQTLMAMKLFGQAAGSGDQARRLEREMQALASLDHPAIVQIYDQGRTGPTDLCGPDRPYMVMELAGGGTALERCGRMRWPELREALVTLLDALTHAHAHGIVHLDIKPSNVLTNTDRSAWALSDFGLAEAILRPTANRPTKVVGTPNTMAPEQIEGRTSELGPWTDLYALGCTAWAMATGALPFARPSMLDTLKAHLTEQPGPFVPTCEVPWGFESWLRRLLAKTPGHRFLRAAIARTELEWLDAAVGSEAEGVDDPPTDTLPFRQQVAPNGLGLGLWGLRPAPMVGRTRELNVLRNAFHRSMTANRASLVVVSGAQKVGKSRLCQAFANEVHASGRAQVWTVRHSHRLDPDSGLRAMVQRGLRYPGAGLLKAAADVDLPSDPNEQRLLRHWLQGDPALLPIERWSLVSSVIRQSRVGPGTVVWIDDAQWGADALGWVERALRDVRFPLLVVVSAGECAHTPADAEALVRLRALDDLPETTHLPLTGLRGEDTTSMLRDVLGFHPDTARELSTQAKGSPSDAIGLVDDLLRAGRLHASSTGFRAAS